MISPASILPKTVLLTRDHLAADISDGAIANAFAATTVGLAVDTELLQHEGAVTALETLRVLLAGMCIKLQIDVRGRDRGCRPLLAPFATGNWLDSLASYREHASAPLTVGALNSNCNVRIGMGVSGDDVDFEMAADNISCWLRGVRGGTKWNKSTVWTGAGSAVLAAAEIYKLTIRALAVAQNANRELFSVRDFVWHLPPSIPSLPGRVGIVSGGAITNSFLFMLIRVRIALSADIWDDDVVAVDNLNRYPLFDVHQLNMPKVEAVAGLALPGLTINPIPRRFGADEPTDLTAFFVGADQVLARWDVSRRQPALAGIGSTDHFLTLNSVHRRNAGGCGACLHARDDGIQGQIPTVSFVSFVAGLELAHMTVRLPAISRYVLTTTWLRPDHEAVRVTGDVPLNASCPIECMGHTVSSANLN